MRVTQKEINERTEEFLNEQWIYCKYGWFTVSRYELLQRIFKGIGICRI